MRKQTTHLVFLTSRDSTRGSGRDRGNHKIKLFETVSDEESDIYCLNH